MSSEPDHRAGDTPPGDDASDSTKREVRTTNSVEREDDVDGDEIVQEPPVTIDEVGRPNYEAEAAVRRGWLQELIRSSLALLFTLLLFATVGFACWAATTSHWESAKELLQILLPAETALLGSATGFYYGTRR